MKIACVGAGPAGLYLSILLKLREPGHDITIYERREPGTAAGWGVTFGRTLLARLRQQDFESAEQIKAAAVRWDDQVIHLHGAQMCAPYDGSYHISRRRMLDILADRAQELGVRIEYRHEVRSLADLPAADLIVAADGAGSLLRAESADFGTQDIWGKNKYIWLGTDKSFPAFNFFFVPTPKGWIWAHVYGIEPGMSTFIVECAPETWAGLGFDALPAQEALPVLGELFGQYLDGGRLFGAGASPGGDPGDDGAVAGWLNFRTVSNRHWHSGNVVLVGDSAHTSHFGIGMGATLALEDVLVLADCLREHADLAAALKAYEHRRQAALRPALNQARCSARWFEQIPRYIDAGPRRFGTLFQARRSPIVTTLPPSLSYLLLQARPARLAHRKPPRPAGRHRMTR